jgi:hypothetical protein
MSPNTNMNVAANTLRMPLASRGSKRYIRSYNTNCTLCNPNAHILFKLPLLEVIKLRLKWVEMQTTTNFIMPSYVNFSLMCTVKRQFLVLGSTSSSWPLWWCQRRHWRRFLKQTPWNSQGVLCLRATSHTRPRAHDYYTSSTLIGGKGGACPSSLRPTTLEGPMEYVTARWM